MPLSRSEGQWWLSPSCILQATTTLSQAPGTPCGSVPRQVCSVQWWGRAAPLGSVSGQATRPAGWDTGKMGFAERGWVPMQGELGAAGHTRALQPRGSHPQHRAESVICNPVKMQGPVNVNISSLKSLMKETRKRVACM